MQLLLRGITRADAPPPRLTFDGLVHVEAASLRAFASCSEVKTTLGRGELLEHHRIVHELHWRTRACLPVRFPTWFDSEAAVRTSLEHREPELGAALERIRDRAELALTVVAAALDEREPTRGGPGTRYLRQRATTLSRAEALAAALRERAGDEVLDISQSIMPRSGVLVSIAVLVNMDRADAVAEHLRDAAPDGEDVRILVNGPWPPYTFAVVPAREG